MRRVMLWIANRRLALWLPIDAWVGRRVEAATAMVQRWAAR